MYSYWSNKVQIFRKRGLRKKFKVSTIDIQIKQSRLKIYPILKFSSPDTQKYTDPQNKIKGRLSSNVYY